MQIVHSSGELVSLAGPKTSAIYYWHIGPYWDR